MLEHLLGFHLATSKQELVSVCCFQPQSAAFSLYRGCVCCGTFHESAVCRPDRPVSLARSRHSSDLPLEYTALLFALRHVTLRHFVCCGRWWRSCRIRIVATDLLRDVSLGTRILIAKPQLLPDEILEKLNHFSCRCSATGWPYHFNVPYTSAMLPPVCIGSLVIFIFKNSLPVLYGVWFLVHTVSGPYVIFHAFMFFFKFCRTCIFFSFVRWWNMSGPSFVTPVQIAVFLQSVYGSSGTCIQCTVSVYCLWNTCNL